MNYNIYEELHRKYGLGEKKKALALISKGAEVLEVGCSTGYLTKILAEEFGCKVDGVEIDKEAAEIASKFTRNIYIGSIEDPIVRDNITQKYDVILFLDVLEHLFDPLNTLKDMKKFLKKEGSIVAMIPNIAYWIMRLQLLFGRFDYQEHGLLDKTHLRFFTRKSIRKMFQDAGFIIIKEDVGIGRMPFFKKTIGQLFPTLFAKHFIVLACLRHD